MDAGEPGIGLAAGQWLVDRKVMMVGTDTWASEAGAPPGPGSALPHASTAAGPQRRSTIIENLDLEELAKEKVYEFAFIFAPLRLKGATGSPGNPIAVR